MTLSKQDDRYLVFLALIFRAREEDGFLIDYQSKIRATEREIAMLRIGIEAEIDGIIWRILSIDPELKYIKVEGIKRIKFRGGTLEVRPCDPIIIELLLAELQEWDQDIDRRIEENPTETKRIETQSRSTTMGFFRSMIENGSLEHYLNQSEADKKHQRNMLLTR